MTSARSGQGGAWRVARRAFLAAIPVHFLWEMAQAHAFTGLPPDAFRATLACAHASLGDGFLTVLVWAVGALVFGRAGWVGPTRWRGWLLLLGLAVVVAMGTEVVLVHGLQRWGYGASMPLLPVLQVGLWPVVQMLLVTPPVLWWAGSIGHRRS